MTHHLKTISTRQLSLLAFIVSLGAKLFSLPILMLKSGGRSAWLPLLVFLAVDVAILGIFIAVSKLAPNKSAFETIENTVGKIISRIVFALVLVGLLLRALLLMLNITSFFSADLFDGVPRPILLLPIALLLVAFSSKSLRTLGRLSEVSIFVIGLAIIGLIVFSIKIANPINLLPLEVNSSDLSRTFISFIFFFGDVSALFVAIGKIDPMGKIKAPKGSLLKELPKSPKEPSLASIVSRPLSPLAIVGAISAVAIVVFYNLSIFSGYMNVRAFLPPSSVAFATHTAVSRFSFGRLDKIIFVILSSASLITLGVLGYAATRTTKFIAPKLKVAYIAFALCLILYLCAVFINTNVFLDFIKSFGIYIAVFMSGFFSLFLLVCAIVAYKKNKGVNVSK